MDIKDVSALLKEAIDLLKKQSIPSARLDAQLLLAHALKKERSFLFAHPDYKPSQKEIQNFYSYIKRRKNREPVAYILGFKEFWDHKFRCTPATLIPRPETETIVELCIKKFSSPPKRILDLGTGTGIIGITLASIWSNDISFLLLSDISFNALLIARENAQNILNENFKKAFFICSDWLSAFNKMAKFDLITVNPPYVSKSQKHLLQPDVIEYEPKTALFSKGKNGLLDIKTIFEQAPRHLKKGGVIICEIGFDQKEQVEELIKKINKYKDIEFYKDLSGIDRVVCATF